MWRRKTYVDVETQNMCGCGDAKHMWMWRRKILRLYGLR